MPHQEIIDTYAPYTGETNRQSSLATDTTQGYRVWGTRSFDLYERSRECTASGCSPWVSHPPRGEIAIGVNVNNGAAALQFENLCRNWRPPVPSIQVCTGMDTGALVCQLLPAQHGGHYCESPVTSVTFTGTLTKNGCLILRGSRQEGSTERSFAVFAPTLRRAGYTLF